MTQLESIVGEAAIGKFVDTMRALVQESRLHFETTGFRCTAVDPANVGMVHAMLGPKAFESYEIDERSTVGINLERFDEAVGFADSGEPVGIETTPDGWLHVSTPGITHELATIDVDSIREEPDIPDLGLPAKIVLEGRQLSKIARAIDTVSDHVELVVDEETETFRAIGKGDTDSVDVEYGSDDLIDFTVAKARSLYSIDYLKDIAQPIPSDAEVEILLGEDFPMKLRWGFAEGYGTVTNMLAPRVEDS